MNRLAHLIFLLGFCACGGKVIVDAPGGTGGAGGNGASSTSSGAVCPAETCKIDPSSPCEPPTGPVGNGCCKCGTDGFCASVCECAAPDTPIATPTGERAIATLQVGDLVYSVGEAQIVVAPIVATHETQVAADHRVVRVHLANGATIDVSRGHPTLDGRSFGDLRRGERLGGVDILDVETITYGYGRTYDILPASDSGGYFAGGALIGSTLEPAKRVDP